jgi:hypothetical protein
MPGLMSGDWKRSTVSGPQRLQPTAWTAPDLLSDRASPRLYLSCDGSDPPRKCVELAFLRHLSRSLVDFFEDESRPFACQQLAIDFARKVRCARATLTRPGRIPKPRCRPGFQTATDLPPRSAIDRVRISLCWCTCVHLQTGELPPSASGSGQRANWRPRTMLERGTECEREFRRCCCAGWSPRSQGCG